MKNLTICALMLLAFSKQVFSLDSQPESLASPFVYFSTQEKISHLKKLKNLIIDAEVKLQNAEKMQIRSGAALRIGGAATTLAALSYGFSSLKMIPKYKFRFSAEEVFQQAKTDSEAARSRNGFNYVEEGEWKSYVDKRLTSAKEIINADNSPRMTILRRFFPMLYQREVNQQLHTLKLDIEANRKLWNLDMIDSAAKSYELQRSNHIAETKSIKSFAKGSGMTLAAFAAIDLLSLGAVTISTRELELIRIYLEEKNNEVDMLMTLIEYGQEDAAAEFLGYEEVIK